MIRYYVESPNGKRLGTFDDLCLAQWTAFHLGDGYKVKWYIENNDRRF